MFFLAGGGSDAGPGVPQVVPGGHRPPLHRAPRLLLPQRHSPHEEDCCHISWQPAARPR